MPNDSDIGSLFSNNVENGFDKAKKDKNSTRKGVESDWLMLMAANG